MNFFQSITNFQLRITNNPRYLILFDEKCRSRRNRTLLLLFPTNEPFLICFVVPPGKPCDLRFTIYDLRFVTIPIRNSYFVILYLNLLMNVFIFFYLFLSISNFLSPFSQFQITQSRKS